MKQQVFVTRLPHALLAWDSPAFVETLRSEIEALPCARLPLDAFTTQGGRVDAAGIKLTVLQATAHVGGLQVRIGVFFTELIGGCSCGDDILPVQTYGEFDVDIDRHDALARFKPRLDCSSPLP